MSSDPTSTGLALADQPHNFDPVAAGREIDRLHDAWQTARENTKAAKEAEREAKAAFVAALIEAHGRVLDFRAFVKDHTHIARSTAYRLIRVAKGDGEEVRRQERTNKQRQREAVSGTSSVPDTNVIPFPKSDPDTNVEWVSPHFPMETVQYEDGPARIPNIPRAAVEAMLTEIEKFQVGPLQDASVPDADIALVDRLDAAEDILRELRHAIEHRSEAVKAALDERWEADQAALMVRRSKAAKKAAATRKRNEAARLADAE